jgi:hypothetical protein
MIPKALCTTWIGAVALCPLLFTVIWPVPTGVAEGRTAAICAGRT